ncbi:bifunctional nicotinamidase/pyrazinamidase [Paroceanicella profunda]|uniref:Nicotinamidase n=1 Tax=Paroceanicella profunda TaxID=2579971 RepID=A0A5B8FWF0_9RHOB|nr:bifunctional nicotinamidase/pyrazinamidase [Paroceanicella profunda]QDL91530.1 bifunctional nicotinamidase/pyrazinamidase [Paroceanicella profunda]
MHDTALLMIDIQTDFCPGGALAVAGGDEVVPLVNRLQDAYPVRVLTQDWHPAGHSSFAASHPGAEPFSLVEMSYGPQVLWPTHCVQGTAGAEFHPDLRRDADLVLRKGFRPGIDSYSAFFENDHETPTGLGGYLRERGVEAVALCGLATDFCVKFSALDAIRLGFGVTLLAEACRGIDMAGSVAAAMAELRAAGVVVA